MLPKKTIMRNVLLSLGLAVFIPCAEGLYAADSDFRITDVRRTVAGTVSARRSGFTVTLPPTSVAAIRLGK